MTTDITELAQRMKAAAEKATRVRGMYMTSHVKTATTALIPAIKNF